MEYVQMTIDEWASLKKEIAEEFARASASFVRIGYLLRKAEDSEGYKNDGYETLAEWAQSELGLTATYVSRFKAINAKYSVDGYSDRLKTEYIGYGSAKLGEMLALPDADMGMISPQTKRQDIRDLKEFNREAPEAEDGEAWARDMMEILPDSVMVALIAYHYDGKLTGRKCCEIVNPGGNKMLRTKAAMIAMSEQGLIVKTFGPAGGRRPVSWDELAQWMNEKEPFRAMKAEEPPEEVVPEPQKSDQTAPESDQTAPKSDQTTPESDQTAAENEQSAAENGQTDPEGGVEQKTDPQGEIVPEPEKETPPAEAQAPIAPAQKPAGSTAERDLQTMIKGLDKAVKGKNWDAALNLLEGIGAAVRKLKRLK